MTVHFVTFHLAASNLCYELMDQFFVVGLLLRTHRHWIINWLTCRRSHKVFVALGLLENFLERRLFLLEAAERSFVLNDCSNLRLFDFRVTAFGGDVFLFLGMAKSVDFFL